MTDPDLKNHPFFPSSPFEAVQGVQPSWKPLLWFMGGLAAAIGLGEILFELILEGLEMLGEGIFYTIEGSEELLEDKIEEWFELDPYHAEIVTAWTMTPVKILLAVIVLRWLWRLGHSKLFPKAVAYIKKQYTAVHLAWRALAWPFKILVTVAAIGGLVILI